jgi:hypothetical protein
MSLGYDGVAKYSLAVFKSIWRFKIFLSEVAKNLNLIL